MPTITETKNYNGFVEKINRLGLQDRYAEVLNAIENFELEVAEEKHANGTRLIREKIDTNFSSSLGWVKTVSGGIDWTSENSRGASLGVEVQVSGRSDLLAVDLLHLRESLSGGSIDVGIIVVPDDQLSRYLTDRTPNYKTALKHIQQHRAEDLPLQVLGFRHDLAGKPIPKMRTNLGKP